VGIHTEDLLERLSDWQELGLVSGTQADAIVAHERERRAEGSAAPPARDRSTAAEAIGYVGAALVLGAIGLFVGEFWDDLTTGGQLVLAALVTIALGGASAALRGSTAPALARLVSVLLVGVVAGVAWCTVIASDGLLGWREDDVALASSAAAVVAAAPLYAARRRALPQLTLLATLLTLLSALLVRTDLSFETFWYALPYAALGAVWILLGEGGYLTPRTVASTTGAIVAILALQVAAFGDLRTLALLLALAVAIGLVAAAVTVGGVHHLAVGAVGLFITVPQLVFELFGDAIGAPATLLLVGVLLVLLAVGLGRAKREVVSQGGAS
jgi:hypothetical protein